VPEVVSLTAADGCVLLSSAQPLGPYPVTVIHSLRDWAGRDPGVPLVAERAADGPWRSCSYGEAVAASDAIGQALLDLGLGPGRPLLILSGNSVDHLLGIAALLQLLDRVARMTGVEVGITLVVEVVDQAGDGCGVRGRRSGSARAGRDRGGAYAIVAAGMRRAPGGFLTSAATEPGPGWPRRSPGWRRTDREDPLHLGLHRVPKGAAEHAPDADRQHADDAAGVAVPDQGPPVLVDWLPWSHTFGGNHDINMIITTGGTLYIDGGRPAPGLFAQTIANLTEVPPTIFLSVPAGYAQLVPALEADPAFAARFFSRLQLIFNAGAALPAALRERITALAAQAGRQGIPVTGAWGATETAPAATAAHYPYTDARCIGIPLPGTQIQLVPAEGAYEIRVKGPNVTPGYFARPDLTAEAFDSEGFYRSGDAVALADPGDPNAGLIFRGRIAEDFKLATGTFVRVGALRTALLSCAPVLSDAVITGQDRPFAGALAWLNATEARALLGAGAPPDGELVVSEELAKTLARALAGHNAGAGSAARIERLAVLARPPDLDAGEITDKGYINQRRGGCPSGRPHRAALRRPAAPASSPRLRPSDGARAFRFDLSGRGHLPRPPGRPGTLTTCLDTMVVAVLAPLSR
jgi:feruloyl-CoA synthase